MNEYSNHLPEGTASRSGTCSPTSGRATSRSPSRPTTATAFGASRTARSSRSSSRATGCLPPLARGSVLKRNRPRRKNWRAVLRCSSAPASSDQASLAPKEAFQKEFSGTRSRSHRRSRGRARDRRRRDGRPASSRSRPAARRTRRLVEGGVEVLGPQLHPTGLELEGLGPDLLQHRPGEAEPVAGELDGQPGRGEGLSRSPISGRRSTR